MCVFPPAVVVEAVAVVQLKAQRQMPGSAVMCCDHLQVARVALLVVEEVGEHPQVVVVVEVEEGAPQLLLQVGVVVELW